MPFARDTLATITANTLADIQSQLAGVDPLLQKSILNIVGSTLSEGLNGLYGYLDWISRQSIPFTAIGEAFYAWAALKKQFPKPATAAAGSWTFAVSAPVTIPALTVITRSDGVVFQTTADTASVGSAVTPPVAAQLPGAAGTIVTGVGGVLSAPIAGVSSSGTGIGGTPGTDIEAFDAFKTRVLEIYAEPPQGGDFTDYVEWAEDLPGVTRAWTRPLGMGPGTVVVYFMMDLAESAFGGFPQGTNGVAAAETRDTPAVGDQLLVANAIYPVQPVTALVYACAPQRNTVAFGIRLPGAGVDLKDAIAGAIAAVFAANGTPGGVTLPGGVPSGIVYMKDIEAALSSIAGTAGLVIVADSCTNGSIAPGPVGDITSDVGYLPALGVITWY